MKNGNVGEIGWPRGGWDGARGITTKNDGYGLTLAGCAGLKIDRFCPKSVKKPK